MVETEFKCSCKLAAIETHRGKLFVGVMEGGAPIAFNEDPRQMVLFTPAKPKEVPRPIEFRQGS